MAITKGDCQLWDCLKKAGHIPPRPTLLQIGQANWFYDADPPEGCPFEEPFAVAQWYYQQILGYSRTVAIDFAGTTQALAFDLNHPLILPGEVPFDVTANTGTIEHCFHQLQCFKTIHDWTKLGGLMVHSFPISGCENHGFYVYQPCLLEDLAFANHYELLARIESDMELGRLCHLAWRKTSDAPFKIPQQRKG